MKKRRPIFYRIPGLEAGIKDPLLPDALVWFNGRVFKIEKFNGMNTYDIVQHPNGERSFKSIPWDELMPYTPPNMTIVN